MPATIPTMKPPKIIKENIKNQHHVINQPDEQEPQVRRSPQTHMHSPQKPASISQSALYAYMGAALEATMDRHVPTAIKKTHNRR